jgi:hypothetical protein
VGCGQENDCSQKQDQCSLTSGLPPVKSLDPESETGGGMDPCGTQVWANGNPSQPRRTVPAKAGHDLERMTGRRSDRGNLGSGDQGWNPGIFE